MNPYDHFTDEDIARRLRRRFNRDLWQELFRRYEKPLLSFIRRYIPNQDTAMDISQETFLRVHRNLRSYDPTRRFKTWCYTIALNLCRSFHRRRHSRGVSLDWSAVDNGYTLGDSLLVDYESDPQRLASRREDRAGVRDAIACLPDKQREVFVLYHMKGVSYDEIARIIRCPVGTVKSRMHSAVRQVRLLLERERARTMEC